MPTNNYFTLSDGQKRQVLQAAESRIQIPAQAIEKDIWVSTILQIVFTLPFASKLLFKGGTSISKVGGLINRFSEDMDLAVDRSLFGFEGDLTKRQLKQLRKASSLFVSNEFTSELKEAANKYGIGHLCTIEAQQDGEGDSTYPEPRKIWIRYSSVFNNPISYINPVVMLEIGSRSLQEPFEVCKIKSLVEENFPTIHTTLTDTEIITAKAEKTFLEKAFLLHELFSVEGKAKIADRKSRHLYDLYMMMNKGIATSAIADDELWENIRHHREIFTSIKGMNYTPDVRSRITLVPNNDDFSVWEADYAQMRASMIYGSNKPSFNDIIEKMRALQELFRAKSIQ